MKTFKHLFGPVPSRRFGRSLGVDLLAPKTCTLDCSFCEVGVTTNLTLKRSEYVPINEVLRELDEWFKSGTQVDYISLSGSGEPTLHSRFGEVLAAVQNKRQYRSALLTNSTLLFLPEVRVAARLADVVKVTLSAWDQASFKAVSSPHPDLKFENVVEGLRLFRAAFSGPIWMEVFIVPGVNSEPHQIEAIAALARTIQPDRIQLNTAVRPTAREEVRELSADKLRHLAVLFTPQAEVIVKYTDVVKDKMPANVDNILALLQRRPCTVEDVAHAFSSPRAEVEKLLSRLEREDLVQSQTRNDELYYHARKA